MIHKSMTKKQTNKQIMFLFISIMGEVNNNNNL